MKNELLGRTDLGFSWELVYSLKNNTFKEGVPLSLLLVSLDDSLKTLQLASQSSCSWTNELILLGRVEVDPTK